MLSYSGGSSGLVYSVAIEMGMALLILLVYFEGVTEYGLGGCGSSGCGIVSSSLLDDSILSSRVAYRESQSTTQV